MRVLKIFFRGDYEDAYIYMGWLHLIKSDRSIYSININIIADSIDSHNSASAPVATYAFARNDWLSGESFRSLMRNREVHQAFFHQFDNIPQPYEVQVKEGYGTLRKSINVKSSALIDLMFYNRRLYIGATDGLYHIDSDWEAEERAPDSVKRHDFRCLNLSARFGMVNSSCGEEGLLASLDDFSYSSQEKSTRNFKKYGNRSVRTTWMGNDFANYKDNTRPDLYLTEQKNTSQSLDGDRRIVSDIKTYEGNIFSRMTDTLRYRHVEETSIQYVFNNKRYFFVHTYDGYYYNFETKVKKDGTVQISFAEKQIKDGDRVISTHPIKDGVAVETDNRIFILSNQKWYTIFEGEALSVRTFSASRRYQNIIAVTHDEGVDLISAINDEVPS